jgi:abortive infection bacteriophage resistance protein
VAPKTPKSHAPKPPLSVADQVALLVGRGLELGSGDREALARLLADNSYARLVPYWRPFQVDPARGDKTFRPGTTVAQIANIYQFDSRLRAAAARGLEVFEVTLRARLGEELAAAGLAYAYLDPTAYAPPARRGGDLRQDLVDAMGRELERTKEPFVARHAQAGQTPPSWAAMGVFTPGTVSKMYRLLADQAARARVARSFGYPDARFAANTFHSLTVLRNIAAHHSRLWHRADIQYAPPVLKRLQTDPDKRVYQRTPWAWLTVLADLVDQVRRDTRYSEALWRLATSRPEYIDGLKRPCGA